MIFILTLSIALNISCFITVYKNQQEIIKIIEKNNNDKL